MAPRKRGMGKSVHSSEQRFFAELMLQAREKAGLTQQRLADQLEEAAIIRGQVRGREAPAGRGEFVAVVRAIGGDPVRILKSLIRGMG